MIEEATIDAYTESEQAGGFHATIEQALDLPFETMVLGVPVYREEDGRDRCQWRCRGLPSRT